MKYRPGAPRAETYDEIMIIISESSKITNSQQQIGFSLSGNSFRVGFTETDKCQRSERLII